MRRTDSRSGIRGSEPSAMHRRPTQSMEGSTCWSALVTSCGRLLCIKQVAALRDDRDQRFPSGWFRSVDVSTDLRFVPECIAPRRDVLERLLPRVAVNLPGLLGRDAA